MEQVMALRIFDHLLVNHGWNATGGIYTPATHVTTDDHANPANEISAAERAEIERRSCWPDSPIGPSWTQPSAAPPAAYRLIRVYRSSNWRPRSASAKDTYQAGCKVRLGRT